MKNVLMPRLGLLMKEGTINKWHKREGDEVKEGELLLEITTEKVTSEVESPASGVLGRILAPEGATVPVATVIAEIVEAGDTIAAPTVERGGSEEQVTARAGKVLASPAAKRLAREKGLDLSLVSPSRPDGFVSEADVVAYLARVEASPVKASPVARKEAERLGVALAAVEGTGPGGKVTRDDVLRAAGWGSGIGDRGSGDGPPASDPRSPTPGAGVDEMGRAFRLEKISSVRAVVGRRMAESARNVAPVTLTTEVDLGECRRLKEALPFKTSYTAILAATVSRALREHPYVNAALPSKDGVLQQKDDSTTEDCLILYSTVNLGIAVDTPTGLLVPSIVSADRKSIKEITEELADLVTRAREGKLTLDELTRGTFTLTNLGMFGIDRFTPIVNLPEVAILGVGEMVERYVPSPNGPVARPLCTFSLTFDHRAIDGAQGARFLATVKQFVQNPYLWLIGG